MGASLSIWPLFVLWILRNSLDPLEWLPSLRNFSNTATGQGAASLLAMNTQDPSRNWSFLRWSKKRAACESTNNRRSSTAKLLKSVRNHRKKPKHPMANITATCTSARLPLSKRDIMRITWSAVRGFLRSGGLARIPRAASATWVTKGFSVTCVRPTFFCTQLTPYKAELMIETDVFSWINLTKYRKNTTGSTCRTGPRHCSAQYFHAPNARR